jgi:LmbE family N-acetylglucosaminyl deacetylase
MNQRVIRGQGTSEAVWAAWPGLATLPRVRPEQLVPAGHRAVIVAPHPDDEILGLGGMLAELTDLGREILLIAATDGTASHPHSATLTERRLGSIRAAETAEALHQLGVHRLTTLRLRLPDGALTAARATLEAQIKHCLRPMDVVFSTWRFDGHPDHEAAGRAARDAAADAAVPFVEVPIWAWHWAQPGDRSIPWARARRVELPPPIFERKRRAAAAYASQISVELRRDLAPVIQPFALARLLRRFEVAFV